MALKVTSRTQPETTVQRGGADSRPDRRRWWDLPSGSDRARAVFAAWQEIQTERASARQLELLHMAMYSAGNVAGEGLKAITRYQSRSPIILRLNICEAICDALQARVAKIRPRPRFLTDNGSWHQRKKAEIAELCMDAEFERAEMDELAPRIALDAFIVGTGGFHTYRDGTGAPQVERCAPGEVAVPYFDGMLQRTRTLYRGRLVERDVVLERAARLGYSARSKVYQQILTAPSAPSHAFSWLRSGSEQSDQVFLIDAWRMGETPKHVVCCGEAEILDDTLWDGKRFPIVALRWKQRQFGWYGKGAIEEITPQQVDINLILEKIQYILHNVSTVRYWAQAGGKIELNAQRMSNFPGELLRFHGANPPIKEVTDSIPREMWEAIDRHESSAYKQTGISEFFAQSEKPAGLDSGEAQRVYEDVGDARMLLKGRAYEKAHLDLVRSLLDVKREIAKDPLEKDKERSLTVKRKRARGVTVQTFKWADFELEEESTVMSLLEQSALPGTPAGRTATVGEWLQLGLVTTDQGKALLDMPDIKANLSLTLSTQDSVLSAIECIAEDGEWYAPHPMLDLQLALQLAVASFTVLEREGLPEARLETVARYIEDLRAMQEAAQPPPAPAPAQLGMQLPQQPAPPPTPVAGY
jgi:hypothetical protein